MYPKNQSFLVMGLSRSGVAVAEFLLKRGSKVFLYDDLEGGTVSKNREHLVSMGGINVPKESLFSMHEQCDVLVLSPGIPIDHPLALSFKRGKKAVTGEAEIAAKYLTCPAIAVTGTNGKTTTVSMIESILKEGGLQAKACGNIGAPLVGVVEEGLDVAVAEISSFQLETLSSLCPHISVVLNVTEDHLTRHYNMENYIFLKGKLLKNSTESEYAVLNYDDDIAQSFAEKTKATVVYFSTKSRTNGGYLEGTDLCFNGEKILSAQDLLLDGAHNLSNALASITVAKLMGIENGAIRRALASFKGIAHRIEFVCEADGVSYVDDSKGTNVDATIKAVSSMKTNTTLLLGGKNKGYDYDKLFSFLVTSKGVRAVLYGENRFALYESAFRQGYKNVYLCPDFAFAVRMAREATPRGETVLLSPASASFDEFESYEERGERFVSIVRSFANETRAEEKNLETREE